MNNPEYYRLMLVFIFSVQLYLCILFFFKMSTATYVLDALILFLLLANFKQLDHLKV